jgi:hypothetical protein
MRLIRLVAPGELVRLIGMVLALLLVALLFWWAAYKLMVYALPCFVGWTAGRLAWENGAGWLGALLVFGAGALLAWALMRGVYAAVRAPAWRGVLALAWVTPSAVLGYSLLYALSAAGIDAEGWRQGFCIFGTGMVCWLSFVRLREGEEAASNLLHGAP